MNLNKDALKELEKYWYAILIPKNLGEEVGFEVREKTEKNAKRNARRTLECILKDRIKILAILPVHPVVSRELKRAEEQLKELIEFMEMLRDQYKKKAKEFTEPRMRKPINFEVRK